MEIPNVKIPEDVSAEAREFIEEFNLLIDRTNKENAEFQGLLLTSEGIARQKEILANAEAVLDRFKSIKTELPKYGLEWMDWPETIE